MMTDQLCRIAIRFEGKLTRVVDCEHEYERQQLIQRLRLLFKRFYPEATCEEFD